MCSPFYRLDSKEKMEIKTMDFIYVVNNDTLKSQLQSSSLYIIVKLDTNN